MINRQVKLKNLMFWARLAVPIIIQIFTYLGLTAEDLNSWQKLGEVLLQIISNPYILGYVLMSIYNAVTDPDKMIFSDRE